jgi:hypothetical protein
MHSRNSLIALNSAGTLMRVNVETGAQLDYANLGATGFTGFTLRSAPHEYFAVRDLGATHELVRVDVGAATTSFAATLPFDTVLGFSCSAAGVFSIAVDGGPGNNDLRYEFNLSTGLISGPQTLQNATLVQGIVANPLGRFWIWDRTKGLLDSVYGGQSTEITPGNTNDGPFHALAMNSYGQLFASGDRFFRVHVPSESLTQIQSIALGPIAGMTFTRGYEYPVPYTYCTAQVNSAGCTPFLRFDGPDVPSASSGSGFRIFAASVLAQKQGLLFYGLAGPHNAPFLGGFLCVKSPVRRTPVQSSGGTTGCLGSFLLDFNQYIASGIDPALEGGVQVNVQWWSRDPAAPSTTNLTKGGEFVISP